MTRSMHDSRAYRSATQGRATTTSSEVSKTPRTARIAGRDITASPIQLVARTHTRATEAGLRATPFSINVVRGRLAMAKTNGFRIRGTTFLYRTSRAWKRTRPNPPAFDGIAAHGRKYLRPGERGFVCVFRSGWFC